VCFVVLYSSQDHLRIGTHDLDHPIFCRCKKHRHYQIVDNNLYKASISGPLLRCLNKADGKELIFDVYAGVCRGHIGYRASLWRSHWLSSIGRQNPPTRFLLANNDDDTTKLVAMCEGSQIFSHCSKAPAQPL
jgi:hypothetical protein